MICGHIVCPQAALPAFVKGIEMKYLFRAEKRLKNLNILLHYRVKICRQNSFERNLIVLMRKVKICLKVLPILLPLLLSLLVFASCEATYSVTVNYYCETSDGQYELQKTETVSAATADFTLSPEAPAHYSVDTTRSTLSADLSSTEEAVLNVYFKADRYTVTFDIGALNLLQGELTQEVFYGASAVPPTVTDSDLSAFLSWDTDFSAVSSDLTVTANCNTDAAVTVRYFLETLDGTYVCSDSKSITVDASKGVYAYEEEHIAHYTLQPAYGTLNCSPSIREASVLDVYYERESYTVSFDASGLDLIRGTLTQTVKYGAVPEYPVTADNTRCKFLAWDTDLSAGVSESVTVSAIVDSDATVNISIYEENLNGSYDFVSTVGVTANAQNGNYAYSPAEKTGFHIDPVKSSTETSLTVGGTYALSVYYTRNRYTVEFDLAGLTLVSGLTTQTVPYGGSAWAPTVQNSEACAFLNWNTSFDAITADTVIRAVVTSDATVNVVYYVETLSGTYEQISTSTISVSTTLGSYTFVPDTREHCTVNTAKSALTVTPNILTPATVSVYYDLLRCTVTFDIGKLTYVNGSLEQKIPYGGSATAPLVQSSASAAFVGWDCSFDSVSEDLTVHAVVTTDAVVNIVCYAETLGGGYEEISSTSISVSTLPGSYTYAPAGLVNHTINKDASTLTVVPNILSPETVSVYYDLVRYTVTFTVEGLDHIGGGNLVQSVPHGGAAVAPEVSGTRTCAFKNWSRTFDKVTSDLTVKAVTTSHATVTLSIYIENLDGGYDLDATSSVNVSAQSGTYTYAPYTKNGFEIDPLYSNVSCELTAGETASLNIYYARKRYTVTFVCDGLSLISGNAVQSIPYQGSATAPTLKNTDTVIFTAWDRDFSSVTSNLTITALTETYTPIYNRIDLECIALDLSGNYVLMADISLSGTEWTPLGTFTGKLLGNGHSIVGLTLTNKNQSGLFTQNRGVIDGVTLKSCAISNTIKNDNNWAISNGLLAYSNSGTIQNCTLAGGNYIMYDFTCIQSIGCYSDSAFTNYNWTNNYSGGGLVAVNNGVIKNCLITGTLQFIAQAAIEYEFNTWLYTNAGSGSFRINLRATFGGFAATNNGQIESCSSTGSVITSASAYAKSTTTGSGYNHAYAYTYATAGTIAGVNNATINGCRTLALEKDSGYSTYRNDYSHASSSITCDSTRNGLVGSNAGTITSSVATTN